MASGPVTIPAEDYTQPALPVTKKGWAINCVDLQIVTKSEGWNQDHTKRMNEFAEIAKTGANYVALAVPYDNVTKALNYATDAHAAGFGIIFRPHHNAWEGDNSVGGITSINRSGSTATVITATAHGMLTGDTVSIEGADQTDYWGEYAITVVDTTTFTYTVANSPATPATGTLRWRYSADTYINKTYDFFVANPTIIQAGDMIGACVEANNANDNHNVTFRNSDDYTNVNNFNFTKFKRFQRNQVTYMNAAMKAIGLGGKVHTWPISHGMYSLSGEVLYGTNGSNGSGGQVNGFTNADMVAYFASRFSVDHYSDQSLNPTALAIAYSADLDHFHNAFPSCKIFMEEFGYPTSNAAPDGQQLGVYDAMLKAARTKTYLCGMNMWVHMGSSISSLWIDNSSVIVPGGRKAVKAVTDAFNSGNSSTYRRIRK